MRRWRVVEATKMKLQGRLRGASVFQLIYASYMRRPISNADRSQIATSAAKNNRRDGVTGMLLECGDEFIQVLEGERRAVKRVFTRLAEDERHANVSILSTGMIVERGFPDWPMGCFHLAPEDLPQEIFIDDGTNSRRLRDDASVSVGLYLADFYKRHRASGRDGAYVVVPPGHGRLAS